MADNNALPDRTPSRQPGFADLFMQPGRAPNGAFPGQNLPHSKISVDDDNATTEHLGEGPSSARCFLRILPPIEFESNRQAPLNCDSLTANWPPSKILTWREPGHALTPSVIHAKPHISQLPFLPAISNINLSTPWSFAFDTILRSSPRLYSDSSRCITSVICSTVDSI